MRECKFHLTRALTAEPAHVCATIWFGKQFEGGEKLEDLYAYIHKDVSLF